MQSSAWLLGAGASPSRNTAPTPAVGTRTTNSEGDPLARWHPEGARQRHLRDHRWCRTYPVESSRDSDPTSRLTSALASSSIHRNHGTSATPMGGLHSGAIQG